MSRWHNGVVIGKFYPPTLGHSYLISYALERVDQLFVIVCDHESQTISGVQRADWIAEMHPEACVLVVPDELDPDDSQAWADFTIEVLGFVPEVAFTSEEYGEAYAYFMGCDHELVDLDREVVPCSATMVRSDPLLYWEFIPKAVRPHYVKRVTVIGVESTGKSTLTLDLARALQTAFVPEYGRTYAEGKQYLADYTDGWQSREFWHIAQAHDQMTDQLAKHANRYLISDTDAFLTTIWHLRYMGFPIDDLEHLIEKQQPDLYIVTDPTTPFDQDGTRDGEHIRQEMHDWMIEELEQRGYNYLLVTGSPEERLEQALTAIYELSLP